MSRWEKTSGKTLVWSSVEPVVGRDPEDQARKLLEENRMSAGSAHWLLKEEIRGLAKTRLGLFPRAKLLALDEPDAWDPEAAQWIREIPCSRRVETERTPLGAGAVVWRPSGPSNKRWIRCETTRLGAGEWVMENLKEKGEETLVIIVQTEKEKWSHYLQARGETAEIRHATETEGRTWDKILIPSLTKQWGGATLGRDWLDLVASRAKLQCVARIGADGPPSWIPTPEEGKTILCWEP